MIRHPSGRPAPLALSMMLMDRLDMDGDAVVEALDQAQEDTLKLAQGLCLASLLGDSPAPGEGSSGAGQDLGAGNAGAPEGGHSTRVAPRAAAPSSNCRPPCHGWRRRSPNRADIGAGSVRGRLPAWQTRALPKARGFLVLPVLVDGRPMGFFYADREVVNAPPPDAAQSDAIRLLRNEIALAPRTEPAVR